MFSFSEGRFLLAYSGSGDPGEMTCSMAIFIRVFTVGKSTSLGDVETVINCFQQLSACRKK